MHPFFKPKPAGTGALSATPIATPYQRAGQVWDDRMGLTLSHARNWRRMAFGALVFAGFLGAGWWAQAQRSVVKPFIVEVSSWGQTQKITALDQTYRPNEAQVSFALARWIADVRGKSIDPVLIRQNWMRAYDFTTPKSAAYLNSWAQEHDPFANAGREAIAVSVLNVVARSERTFDIQWREEKFANGMSAGAERWRALVTVRFELPRSEADLMKNPLGIRIEDVSWTPDAQ
jgi:type IV secretion system protein VirB5